VVQEVYQESEAGLFQKFKQLPGDPWLSMWQVLKIMQGPLKKAASMSVNLYGSIAASAPPCTILGTEFAIKLCSEVVRQRK